VAVNDSIVKIDFINQARRSGTPLREAILLAGQARFRPIVMTTVTTVIGLLPMALGFGEGAELQQPLAITVLGGIILSTFVSLFLVPVLYLIFERE
jgi:HAE1 family hydrophobic/amphiphilic exporter-1